MTAETRPAAGRHPEPLETADGVEPPATAELLVVGITELVSAERPGPHRGFAQGAALRVTRDAAIAVDGASVTWTGPAGAWTGRADRTHDLGGRAVVPGLVDPHTHLLWAGDRLDDFEARATGARYEELLKRGGGIRSTVRATAAAEPGELVEASLPRVDALIRSGATTIEVKSGYGGTIEAELRSLEVIRDLAARTRARIVPTLLLHVPPTSDRSGWLAAAAQELVPEVARRGLARRVDVFVEREAFGVDEARVLLTAARDAGLDRVLHVDQFASLGGVSLGVELGARSLDHLEASGARQVEAIARSPVVATLLPGVSIELGLPGAKGRALVDAGAAVAVATDLNPGSSPLASTALALALSVRVNGLTPAEALVAATVNAAAALGLDDVGRVGAGSRADLLVLPGRDWRILAAELAPVRPFEVWIGGRPVTAGAGAAAPGTVGDG